MQHGWSNVEKNEKVTKANVVGNYENQKPLLAKEDVSIGYPLIAKHFGIGNYLHNGNRRKLVGWVIAFICLGVLILTFAASGITFLRLYQQRQHSWKKNLMRYH